jgi:hypothetical protein
MLKSLRYFASAISLLLAFPACAQVAAPDTSSQRISVSNSSGTVAAATATATLPATPGRYTYICGFSITSSGSTAAAVVAATVTSVVGGTMTYTYTSVAGATLANTPLIVAFTPCLPATAANTTIPVSIPSLGSGNTNTTVTAWGFQWSISE